MSSKQKSADVCFVLEGTYPYVAGGVSSWVNHLITKMPDTSFSILHISPHRGFFKKRAYKLPDNVIELQEVYLHAGFKWGGIFKRKPPDSDVRALCAFFDRMREGDHSMFPDLVRRFGKHKNALTGELLLNKQNWAVLTKQFDEESPEESFLNYFWNWYYANQPLVNILTAKTPKARTYHTVSTGYAGVLASAAAIRHDRPMILTEHGIYTKERRIEIYAAEWIHDRPGDEFLVDKQAPYFRRFWNHQFQMMSRICYDHASEIFTLYKGNTREQIKDGADPAKIRVIPNGIDLKRFAEAAETFANRPPNERFTVGFVGRVCPIKDVRTFIAAMRLVTNQVPDVLVRILGPMEEDPEYAEDCQQFARALDLDANVRFEGRVPVHEEMPKLDVLVLTSISEAQPLVVLEGGAVGLPSVTTDVGCCHELLGGTTPEDRALGRGGLVTPIASPGATADAVLQLWEDESARKQMGRNLQARVARFYNQDDMVGDYHDIYVHHSELEVC